MIHESIIRKRKTRNKLHKEKEKRPKKRGKLLHLHRGGEVAMDRDIFLLRTLTYHPLLLPMSTRLILLPPLLLPFLQLAQSRRRTARARR